MDQGQEYRFQKISEYKNMLAPFIRYLPWLEQSAGSSVSKEYNGAELGEQVMRFPVYDGTLISFVKELQKSPLMDRNYRYIYTRNNIRDHDDERKVIARATIKEWDLLRGILSRYALGGQTKALLWNEAVQERIFYLAISKMCEIIEYWDKPIQK